MKPDINTKKWPIAMFQTCRARHSVSAIESDTKIEKIRTSKQDTLDRIGVGDFNARVLLAERAKRKEGEEKPPWCLYAERTAPTINSWSLHGVRVWMHRVLHVQPTKVTQLNN